MKIHRLRALKGSLAGQTFDLRRRTLLGRGGEAHVQVIERDVSRQHALIFQREDGKMLLVDLSSTNGTQIANQRVSRAELQPQDEILIGTSVFIYEVVDGAASTVEFERDADETEDLKVLSGPALDTTAVSADVEASPSGVTDPANPTLRLHGEALDCGDPVHPVAIESQWAYCPACGAKLQ